MVDKAEIRQLTALRGVAAMLVVMYHFKKEFGTTINLDSYTQIFECGYLWVDFFFILSGFVMGLVYADFLAWPITPVRYRQFLTKRLARIYPLHIFTFVLFIPTEAAKLFLASNADPAFSVNSPGAMLSNILLIQAWHVHSSATWNQPAWSISAEWAAYLLPRFCSFLCSGAARSAPAVWRGCWWRDWFRSTSSWDMARWTSRMISLSRAARCLSRWGC
jgi:peptidoglycan/LPS O-acetylase OafA/YrhL